jgi:hypothetical protein
MPCAYLWSPPSVGSAVPTLDYPTYIKCHFPKTPCVYLWPPP